MTSSLRIIVSGLIAQHYSLGGVAWDYLQYLIGLKNLGHDVWYFEDSGEWPYTLDGGPSGNDWVAKDCLLNIRYLEKVFQFAGMSGRWAYHFPTHSQWFGISDSKRKEILETADLLVNVSGSIDDMAKYMAIKKRVYIDSDPGFTQLKIKMGDEDISNRIRNHSNHFSFGEKVMNAFENPDMMWHPTRTPIVLSCWEPRRTGSRFTTIMNWTSYKPVVFDGVSYGQKDTQFVKFLELPKLQTKSRFEVALSKTVHKNWLSNVAGDSRAESFDTPAQMLVAFGWGVVDPSSVCRDLFSYRDYIQNSKGEWSVAKGGYVETKPGWFSCRSACYLAAGKPVVVQDTGFEEVIPTGIGVHSFRTLEDAIFGIEQIDRDYDNECEAARSIAEEYFNADGVLLRLLEVAYSSPSEKIDNQKRPQ
jgi:hypothetical protein